MRTTSANAWRISSWVALSSGTASYLPSSCSLGSTGYGGPDDHRSSSTRPLSLRGDVSIHLQSIDGASPGAAMIFSIRLWALSGGALALRVSGSVERKTELLRGTLFLVLLSSLRDGPCLLIHSIYHSAPWSIPSLDTRSWPPDLPGSLKLLSS